MGFIEMDALNMTAPQSRPNRADEIYANWKMGDLALARELRDLANELQRDLDAANEARERARRAEDLLLEVYRNPAEPGVPGSTLFGKIHCWWNLNFATHPTLAQPTADNKEGKT